MPLFDDYLSVWKISFRWAGLDPDSLKYRLYIPIEVKDNIRLVLNAVITNILFCPSLKPDTLLAHATTRDQGNLDKLHDCIIDKKYDRDFLQSNIVYRFDFAHWCNRSGIPYPEFWFPVGWVVHELQEKDRLAIEDTRPRPTEHLKTETLIIQKSSGKRFDAEEYIWKPAKIAAQTIWSQNKAISIAGVVQKIKEMPELKASSLSASAIRKQIANLSPTPGKPGRKPLKKST